MKKALFSILLFAAMIQFISCSDGSKEIAQSPENDSTKITQENLVEPKIITIGVNDFDAIALSAKETKKVLIAGSQWMWFSTFAGNTSDSTLFAKYQAFRETMKDVNEPIGDTLTFSAPDEYTHVIQFEPSKKSFVGNEPYSFNKKDNKNISKGNFQITDQHNLILNAEKGHEKNEQFSIAVLNKDVMYIEEEISFEGKNFLVYKRYIRIGELKK